MEFYDRLQKLCRDKNTSITALLEKHKLSSSKGTMWKNGTLPKIDVALIISEELNVSLDYLFTGKESLPSELSKDEQELLTYFKDLPHDQQQQLIGMAILLREQVKEQDNEDIDEVKEELEIIYLNYNPEFRVSAGLGKELPDYQQWDKAAVVETSESRKANFILTVDGDSMEPKFYKDDLVLIREQPDIDDGQIGIFRLNGEGYIKKKIGNRLISLNKKYHDLLINSEDYRCFGLVLGTTEIIKPDELLNA